MNWQSLLGLADFWSKDYRKFYPWGFAMNGQTSRLEFTRQIIHRLKMEMIVETGTYRGTTTEWFCQFGIPVETVETNDRYQEFARARLRNYANVVLVKGSSVPFLKERIAANRVRADTRQFFYLDSHWQNYLPLRDELELIFNHYTGAVVMVDDFNVIDDSGYGYDNYGPERALTLGYVSSSKVPALYCYFPATPSRQETGARRGSVVLTSSGVLAAELNQITLLRAYQFAA